LDFLRRHVEALIFCSPSPISDNEITKCLIDAFESEISLEDVHKVLGELEAQYNKDHYSFHIIQSGGGYQFLSKAEYHSTIEVLLKQQSKKRLSKASLETLSIIAYKQPVTKGAIEQIRGVNCDYAVQKLLEKELVEIKGKSESVGRPLLYGTSQKFMDYFSINSLNDLPRLKDLSDVSQGEFNKEVNKDSNG